jgi:hypothetical protein
MAQGSMIPNAIAVYNKAGGGQNWFASGYYTAQKRRIAIDKITTVLVYLVDHHQAIRVLIAIIEIACYPECEVKFVVPKERS